jgi:hypothetical protein
MLMALALIMTIQYERPPDVGARKMSDFNKVGMGRVADYWQDKYLPHHFSDYAKVKYNYQKRRPKTNKRKRKLAKTGEVKKGGRVPLVWSGTLERQMKRPGILRVYPTRFVLRKPAGPYITNRPRGRRPNMVKEITTVIPSEERRLADVFENVVAEQLTKYRARRRVRP